MSLKNGNGVERQMKTPCAFPTCGNGRYASSNLCQAHDAIWGESPEFRRVMKISMSWTGSRPSNLEARCASIQAEWVERVRCEELVK